MKNLKTSFLCVGLFVGICSPEKLIGQEIEEAPSHEGFFLRFLAGGGSGSIVIDNDMTFKSSAGLFHFQIGGEISKNLVLFGDIDGFSLSEPEMEYGGTTSTFTDGSINTFGVGIGLSYYLMPANIYLTRSLMLTGTTIEYQDQDLGESKMGSGLSLLLVRSGGSVKNGGLSVAGFYEGA